MRRHTLSATFLSLSLITACGNPSRGNNGNKDAGVIVYDDGGNVVSTDLATPTVSTTVIAPNTPMNAPTLFGGADDPSLAPEPVYPPAGALIPPNLNILEFQWKPGGADLFELSLQGMGVNLKIYTVCNVVGTGCALTPDENTWKILSGAAHGRTLMVTVRGTKLAGGDVGTSPAQALSFSDEDMLGGLYYWAATPGGIYRYDFGLRGQKAESFYTPAQAGNVQCVGCHALSRNGKRIAVGLNAPLPAALRVLDVATRKTLFDQGTMFGGGSNYEAITPDGSKVLTSESPNMFSMTTDLVLRDAATGTVVGTNPALANGNMPDFAADGTKVVFARSGSFASALSVEAGSLFTAPFTGTSFGAVKQIVAGGTKNNNYYPSFSPDGMFIAYDNSQTASFDAADARVRVVSSAGGTPIELAIVNTLPGNSWPKFSPFVHHFQGSTIFWITYSSRRSIGLRDNTTSQIWMVPVDAGKLAQGQDPNFPPIWLPFQDSTTGNHIAQWVEKVERAPCSQIDQSGCMAGEQCVDGVCVPIIM